MIICSRKLFSQVESNYFEAQLVLFIENLRYGGNFNDFLELFIKKIKKPRNFKNSYPVHYCITTHFL